MISYLRMAKALLLLVAAGIVFTFARYFAEMRHGASAVAMRVGNAELSVEIRKTPMERTHGLSGRPDLQNDRGILFVFEEPDVYPFWMKEMRFPIDIIWIERGSDITGQPIVADVTANISPDSFPERFTPPVPVRYAIEVNAGWAEQHGIQIGDPVVLPEN